jgi:flavodoxin
MLKYILYAVLAVAAICLVGAAVHNLRVYFQNKKEMSRYEGAKISVTKDFGKSLVVYYSFSGNTRKIAEKIKEAAGADIYEIKTKETLKSGPSLYMEIKKQLKTGTYPAVEENFPDFSAYDYIFVGSPVWWYTAATPVLSFLDKADFGGKKVVPFSTQGSNAGNFAADFKAKAKNAVVIEGAGFNNISKEYDAAVDNKIAEMLNKL